MTGIYFLQHAKGQVKPKTWRW